jgi:hypothetical protein
MTISSKTSTLTDDNVESPWSFHGSPRRQNPCNPRKLRVFPTSLWKNLRTWVEKHRPDSKNTIPHRQCLWNRRTSLRHPNRKSGKRMRSRIHLMSTSTRVQTHLHTASTKVNDNGRPPRTKRRRTRTLSSTPDDKTVDNTIRVINPLVTQPPDSITIQSVPNLTAQERKSTMRVHDHPRTRYKTRFWPLYAMSYHKAKRASQSETVFRMSLTSDDIMKLGFHDLNTYTRTSDVYGRHSWEVSCGESAIRSFQQGRYQSITACALVWMSYDIRDPRRRIMADIGRILSRLHRGVVRAHP